MSLALRLYKWWSLADVLRDVGTSHQGVQFSTALKASIAYALGAEQMCVDHICLEPTPDLEEEACVLCV